MDARATTTAFQRGLGLVDGERQRLDCLTTSLFGRRARRTEHLGDTQCGGGHIGMTRVGSKSREPVGDGTRRRVIPRSRACPKLTALTMTTDRSGVASSKSDTVMSCGPRASVSGEWGSSIWCTPVCHSQILPSVDTCLHPIGKAGRSPLTRWLNFWRHPCGGASHLPDDLKSRHGFDLCSTKGEVHRRVRQACGQRPSRCPFGQPDITGATIWQSHPFRMHRARTRESPRVVDAATRRVNPVGRLRKNSRRMLGQGLCAHALLAHMSGFRWTALASDVPVFILWAARAGWPAHPFSSYRHTDGVLATAILANRGFAHR